MLIVFSAQKRNLLFGDMVYFDCFCGDDITDVRQMNLLVGL